MENLQTEIESMTGVETAKTAEAVSWWGKLWVSLMAWWAWRRLPRGQRMVKMGFKAVTMGNLAERFALKKMTDRLYDGYIKDCLADKGLTPEQVKIKDVKTWPVIGRGSVTWTLLDGSGYDYAQFTFPESSSREAVIKLSKLSEYVNDEIPARCLASVERARKLGLSKFYVAYPAVENVPQKDPVIVTPWSGKAHNPNTIYLEIDMWE